MDVTYRPRLFCIALVAVGLCAGILGEVCLGGTVRAAPFWTAAEGTAPSGAGDYIVLAWNDLGMHCYNSSFADLAVLPPFNTLWAQVVQVGDPPRIVTSGITVTYVISGNTESATKSDFWDYAQKLFGLSGPLPPNVGLTGKTLSDSMDARGDHFEAVGIPLTEYLDISPTVRAPFQLAIVTVHDAVSGAVLAETTTVAPVSSEMHCDNCHGDAGDATRGYPITPTGKVETNILTLHDYLSSSKYPSQYPDLLMGAEQRPVLCAKCHSSNALGAAGVVGVSSLSNAMHNHHKSLPDITPDANGCYNCHPGPQTQCLRDVMSQKYGISCVNCHDTIDHVATNASPWLVEPKCETCHGSGYVTDQALYRKSKGHGRLYCAGCHDSPHAIAPSREPNDGLKFVALQGQSGTLYVCTTCHATEPVQTFSHKPSPLHVFLPFVQRQ
jgi:hypothetical protein